MTLSNPKEAIERLSVLLLRLKEKAFTRSTWDDNALAQSRVEQEQWEADLRALIADHGRLDAGWQAANTRALEIGLRLSALEGACKPFLEALEEAEDRYPEAGSAYMVEEARSHLSADHFRILRQALASTVPVQEEGKAVDKDELTDLVSEAITGSMDMNWSASDGARSVVAALVKENIVRITP